MTTSNATIDMPEPKLGLSEKYAYEELTEKQQAVVDALITYKDPTIEEIAENVGCSDSYVDAVKASYPHIIEEREHTLNNQHATVEKGNVRVEGEIDLSDPDVYPREQSIRERPVKSVSSEAAEPRIDDFLDEDTCERLEAIADDISPNWLDRRASPVEVIDALSRYWYGEKL